MGKFEPRMKLEYTKHTFRCQIIQQLAEYVPDVKQIEEWIESSSEKKDLGLLVDEKLNMSCQRVLAAQKAKHILDCMKRSMTSRVEGGGETLLGVLCPALESSAQEGHGPVGTGPEEVHKDDQRAGAPFQ
ncbi:rna-directed dna polymerase from mobile element jockey- hypothetical protein [Limosa lapponica baueri]|uniref:Uncharacterized protein n=1 Tax=Limosa lapponica baueri TaxID=1758121 RepID=A0A2I0UTG6_LIMLA|nr:rna-directed dna polymerase from mobile element jockey- hypothetical protein [Limosa lapponica baueri]